MGEIHLGLTEKAHMREKPEGGKEVFLYMDEQPEVKDYDLRQSPRFWLSCYRSLYGDGATRIASPENPLVTPSAGALSFIYDETGKIGYVAMAQKDGGAPRDPGFRVPRNGFPQSEDDWYSMAHLWREAYEEGIFLTRSKELVLPQSGEGEGEIMRRAVFIQGKTPLRIRGTKRVPIEFLDGPDKLSIYRGEDHIKTVDGYVSWTPETGFNFIKPMVVEHPMEDLLLVDPETFPNGDLIGRDYCVIDLKHLQGKVFGDIIHETVHRLKEGSEFRSDVNVFERDDRFFTDKVPRSVLCSFEYDGQPVYPVDWMRESFDFLRRPDVEKALNGAFRFSGYERKLLERS